MSNALSLPGAIALPSMSQPLAEAVRYELASRMPHPGDESAPAHRSSLPPRPLPAALIPEAKRLADAVAGAMRPLTALELAEWLTPINLACTNPQPPEDFSARCRAFAEICAKIPSVAFTADVRRTLAETTKHFPAAAEIIAAVKPEAERISQKLDALRRLAARPPAAEPPPKPEPVSPEQQALDEARTAAMLAEQKARIQASESRGKTQGVKAAPVHPLHLMAAYRNTVRQGGLTAAAAEVRLAKLEEDYPELADQLDHAEAMQAAAQAKAQHQPSKHFA